MLNVHYLTTQHDNSELFFHVLQCNVLLSTISVGTCPFTLSNSSHHFAVDPPLTYVIPSSINCPFHTPFQLLWLVSIVTSELLTSAMTIVCPLLVSCLPLEFTPFSTFSKAMQMAMLKCKGDPVDVNNLACTKALHFKASAVVTPSDCLLCSLILTNFLVFTCQYNSYSRFTACSGSTSDFSLLHSFKVILLYGI